MAVSDPVPAAICLLSIRPPLQQEGIQRASIDHG